MNVRGSLISRKRLPIVGLMLLIILVCALILTAFLSQHAQRIPQRASGNAVYASPGDNLSNKVNSLSAGDTLILHDGLYSSSRLGIDGIHGTSTSPMAIRAEYDGKAVLDGVGPHTIEVSNSAYVVIEGLVVQNPAQGGVVDVEGSDHITIRRISASNANPGNKGKAIAKGGEHRSIDFFDNGSNGTSLNSTDRQVNPGYNVSKYGRGAYLSIPPNSPLIHVGQEGKDIGANIIYRYVDGVLTKQPF